MSSQYRELIAILGDFLSENDFHTRISMNNVGKVKTLFSSKTFLLSEKKEVRPEAFAIQQARLRDVLRRVCNAVLCTKNTNSAVDIGALTSDEEERLAWKFLSGALDANENVVCPIIEGELLRAAVDLHYATARPELCDMFIHLSACEMFFIDGDSLLMAALSPPAVDWDLIQPLHVMYNVQKLLYDLHTRGARFHIVFFDSSMWIWQAAPAKLFLREVLTKSLTSLSESNAKFSLVVRNFPSFHCEAFCEYINTWEPEFILISDGEQLGALNSFQSFFVNSVSAATFAKNRKKDNNSSNRNTVAIEGDKDEEETNNDKNVFKKSGKAPYEQKRAYRSLVEDEIVGDKAAFYYRCIHMWATAQRLKVVYFPRIIYKENAMIVFAVRVDGERFERAVTLGDDVLALAKSMEQNVQLPVISSESLDFLAEEVSYREKIVFSAVHAYLNAVSRSKQERELCQALVITAYVMGLVDNEVRAQSARPNAILTAFLSDMAPFLLAVLRHAENDESCGEVCDIIDGHFLSAIVRQLRTTAAFNLLDENGKGDIECTWQAIVDSEDSSIIEAPLTSLPEVATPDVVELQPYQLITHELVERLAKSFAVTAHRAEVAYPTGFGAANNLAGWDITTTFDKLNDVTDSEGEYILKSMMTEKEMKNMQEYNTKFVRNAFQQAQSMGISGFAAHELAMVCSENEDDGDGVSGGKGNNNAYTKKKVNKEHVGQRNKKTRSKEDEIRERSNVVSATSTVISWHKQMEQHLRNVDPSYGRTSNKDRDEAISVLNAAISRLSKENFGKNFDPGYTVGETIDNASLLKVEMWRVLVAASQLREVEFAFSIDDPSLKQTKSALKKKDNKSLDNNMLYGFTIINQLVAREIDKMGQWGELEPLRKANPDMTSVDAISYLRWVYLCYVERHIQMKLKCRVVKLHLENWRAERERARLAKESPNISVGIPLFLYCHHSVLSVIRDEGLQISPEDIDTVRSALYHFDFADSYYQKIDQAIARWQNKTLARIAPSLLPRYRQLDETPETLQLIHMGHLLERPFMRNRDYRVAFNPDSWQRDLLDIVDNRGSAVVCAPTSAGKTFISYYCMYNALRRSNKKVVVYLAPARALINQAVADVCARYGSKKYKNPGRSIYGVLGGADYHQFHDNCQVLLTVPETFETMLMSPKYAEWVELIDYVILDEIHSMESNGNGDVWERILALLPCPFVALSATLGETQELCGWLNRVQGRLKEQQISESAGKNRDFNVHVLPREGKCIQRWNDIKKYIYLPPPGTKPLLKKLTATYEHRYIQDLHPLSILTTDQLERGFPPDISLVPAEAVSLYKKMFDTFTEAIYPKWASTHLVQTLRAQLLKLDLATYFESETYITQERARQYEADIKNLFVYWVFLGTATEKHLAGITGEKVNEFNETMKTVTAGILSAFAQKLSEDEAVLERYASDAMEKRKIALQQRQQQKEDEKEEEKGVEKDGETVAALTQEEAEEKEINEEDEALKSVPFPGSRQFIREHILNVLRELIARDMGPVIVFSFESEDCGDLVKYVVEYLEEAEELYRKTEEFASYKARVERAAAAQEARRKQRESTLKQKRLTSGDDGNVEVAERDTSDVGEENEELFVVPDVLPEFTFIGEKCVVEPNVVESLLDDCGKEGENLLLRALKRGIGMHHAGVRGKLRGHVERLFRGRHCGVIFSTETLALGIHSPCRSVVLAGDHILLNPTQFRQMMGRAGRRGLDYLGHLVFLGITMRRIKRLMTSSMTVIKGNVQVDPMSNLRLLQLYDFNTLRSLKDETGWKRHILKLAERLFVNPLFFQGRHSATNGNMEEFTVEFLQMLLGFFQREGLHFVQHTSSLGSLLQDAMYVFREAHVGNEGFAFIHLLTSGVFDKACYPPVHDKKLNTGFIDEPIAEILAYLFSTHQTCGVPLEIHRSVLLDPAVRILWESEKLSMHHRVVLAPINVCSPSVAAFDNRDFFAMLSAFYAYLASRLKPQTGSALRLPCVKSGGQTQSIFATKAADLPLNELLKKTSVSFKARSPFVAISGCGDVFTSVDDVTFTLRDGLYCDRRLLPILDLTDGWRHDASQILINACLADFLRAKAQIDQTRKNYRFTLLEELNGLSQSLSYGVLNKIEKTLSNLAGLVRRPTLPHAKVLEAIMPDESEEEGSFMAGAPRILDVAQRLHQLQPQIQKRFAEEVFAAKRAKWASELASRRNEQQQ